MSIRKLIISRFIWLMSFSPFPSFPLSLEVFVEVPNHPLNSRFALGLLRVIRLSNQSAGMDAWEEEEGEVYIEKEVK